MIQEGRLHLLELASMKSEHTEMEAPWKDSQLSQWMIIWVQVAQVAQAESGILQEGGQLW